MPKIAQLERELDHYDTLASVVVGAGFGGLLAGIALGVAASTGRDSVRILVIVVAVLGGLASMLALSALTVSPATHNTKTLVYRKGIPAVIGGNLLFYAMWLGVIAAGLQLLKAY